MRQGRVAQTSFAAVRVQRSPLMGKSSRMASLFERRDRLCERLVELGGDRGVWRVGDRVLRLPVPLVQHDASRLFLRLGIATGGLSR